MNSKNLSGTMTKHGGPRLNTGPKTKAERGLKKHKQLSITLPHDLWLELKALKPDNEPVSQFLARLLDAAIEYQSEVL